MFGLLNSRGQIVVKQDYFSFIAYIQQQFNLTTVDLKLRHGWVITCHTKQLMCLHIHVITWANIFKLNGLQQIVMLKYCVFHTDLVTWKINIALYLFFKKYHILSMDTILRCIHWDIMKTTSSFLYSIIYIKYFLHFLDFQSLVIHSIVTKYDIQIIFTAQ